ncbi:MAG: carbon starvation protein A [Planctomycetaceae bacterium]|nr:carbon starvation protein A [Planctomycetaceae bacterium]
MTTLLIAFGSFVGFIIAYHTYGRWISNKIFGLSANATMPSEALRDDVDFIPTKKEVIFGHHFTSIAGTGPIVGPAIAVFWGWLPALIWVIFGSIFIGAVHDFGALVVSLRNDGQTVGEIAGRLISRRTKLLFLLILFFALTIVLAIFGLVIASIFKIYPESVLSVWIEIPIAVAIGFWVYRKGGGLLLPSLLALGLLYICVYVGVYYLPITLPVSNPVVVWTLALMTYCFIASVLPVWTLLQPRDFINSHQLIVALGLLVLGLAVAGFTGATDLQASAPAIAEIAPAGAPPIMPFLFITIACGAVSGFHCVVSSGTSSKQISCETDAQYVGYGAMLLEGALAVIVILACCAGLGMGVVSEGGEALKHLDAWHTKYDPATGWAAFGLSQKVGAFVEGGANFINALGMRIELATGIIAVLVASFAATTLDTATRLQRYVVQELGQTLNIKPLTNKYTATLIAVSLGAAMAMIPAPGKVMGTGGLILWPLFGATNQLLAGLALMVIFFYLWRRKVNVWFVAIPMVMMLIMPAWALLWQLFNQDSGWAQPLLEMLRGETKWVWDNKHLLMTIGVATLLLQIWIVIEGVLLIPKSRGVLEEILDRK